MGLILRREDSALRRSCQPQSDPIESHGTLSGVRSAAQLMARFLVRQQREVWTQVGRKTGTKVLKRVCRPKNMPEGPCLCSFGP